MHTSKPEIDVIIPNWNGRDWLPDCLDALRAQTCPDFRVTVVDNGSTDDSVEYIRTSHPEVNVLILQHNAGFAAAANHGIRHTQAPFVALLNTDTRAAPSWLEILLHRIKAAEACIGSLATCMVQMGAPQQVDDAGDMLTWYGAARKRGHGRPVAAFAQEQEVFSACAGAALYRRGFLEQLQGFDETFVSYLEDIDLGLRGRLLGYRCLYVPDAVVAHKGHGSVLPHVRYVRYMARNRAMLFKKNIPARLLRRNARKIWYGQLYFMLAHRRPLSTLAGWCSLLPLTMHVLRSRRRFLPRIVLTDDEIQSLLDPDWHEPPLLRSAARIWRRTG